MTVTPQDRAKLDRAIGAARQIIEGDLRRRAEGDYGLVAPSEVQPENVLALSPAALGARRQLVDVVEHLRRTDGDEAGPVGRFLREASFTLLNRLVAVRVAEASGLLPPALADGPRSRGFLDLLELFPLLRDEPTGGYWTFLRLCADELARDAPVLFDPRNPLLALEPSPGALTKVVDVLSDSALNPIWSEPDAFGWTYQFFNRPEERLAMRESSAAPRNSRELAVRNQFFTPRYVVDFLVQNTLGRRLVESGFGQDLAERLGVLVPERGDDGRPLDLDDVRVLDPAVGSGHFLLGCYDVLEAAWQLGGASADEAAPRIVAALWGIDIDPRCAQVAAAAIALHARRRCRDGDLPRPNIFTARALPDDPEAWHQALADLDEHESALVHRIQEVLSDAPVLGPLLKVEDALEREIRAADPTADLDAARLFADVAADAFGRAEATILSAIRQVASEASATPAERLLAAETVDAIGFVDAMRQRYHAVLMNPPFGEPVPDTKPYLRAAYPWIPSRTHDLLTAFVGRGLELCTEDGYLGAITARNGFFLSTFEAWRTEIFLRRHLVAMADLGFGVMEGAYVEAAAYVVGARPRRQEDEATFVRLVKETARAEALANSIARDRQNADSPNVYRVPLADFDEIPGSPMAYWVTPSLRALFRQLPALEGSGAEARQGLASGDDFRFVRAFWEVDPRRVGRSRADTVDGRGWVPFAKGGEYSPFYGDIHLLVDWANDGRPIRETGNDARVQGEKYYFRAGVTWPERTASGFSPRVLPSGCLFSHVGHAAFALDDQWVLLGVMSTRVFESLLASFVAAAEETSSGTPAKRYSVGSVQKLPWLASALGPDAASGVAKATLTATEIRARLDEGDETTRRFICPLVLRYDRTTLRARIEESQAATNLAIVRGIEATLETERALHDALALDREAEEYLDEEYGPHPASYPAAPIEDETNLARLATMPVEDVIDEAIAQRGGSRVIATKAYFLNRRIEILSHLTQRAPRRVVEVLERRALLPPDEPTASATALVSWLVGVAFGRWDVRIGREPDRAPADSGLLGLVSICPPGMLVDEMTRLPPLAPLPDYPFELPSPQILFDDELHRWDVEARVRAAAALLFDDADAILEETEHILGRQLRAYLGRQFFKDHVGRYSKSRRKAPIYWQLSVPSRAWSAWLYAPAISREALYAVARQGNRRRQLALESIERLRAEAGGAAGQALARLDKQRQGAELLAEELAAFVAEAERVAGLGWEPDLDDGMLLCAAPLADLFPAWPEARRMRAALQKGEYPWAKVAGWAEALG